MQAEAPRLSEIELLRRLCWEMGRYLKNERCLLFMSPECQAWVNGEIAKRNPKPRSMEEIGATHSIRKQAVAKLDQQERKALGLDR